jgi:uncharacterized protein
VNNSRRPLRLNVGFLIKASIGTHREFEFGSSQMRLGDDLTVRDFKGKASFDRAQQGLFLQGEFSATVRPDCVRCLEPFNQRLDWSFSDMYAFDKRNITESGLLVPEDAQIDLEPLLREYALLEIPINPICRSDCKGLCLICGENLNLRDCGHKPVKETPFSILKDLLE